MEGIENLEAAQSEPEPVTNNVPDNSKAADPVPADDVPDSGLPIEGDDADAPTQDAVTTHEEDDDPLSNVGEPVE